MSAYQEGYDAYYRGSGKIDNPHTIGTFEESEWERGYDAADDDAREPVYDDCDCYLCMPWNNF